MMDSAIASTGKKKTARAIKFFDVNKGMEIVVGTRESASCRCNDRPRRTDVFRIHLHQCRCGEPKAAIIREMAREFKNARDEKGKIAVVAGPAIVRHRRRRTFGAADQARATSICFSPETRSRRTTWNGPFSGHSLGVNPERALAGGGTRITCAPSTPSANAGSMAAAVGKGNCQARNHACLCAEQRSTSSLPDRSAMKARSRM